MTQRPFVSVILPVRNEAPRIAACLDSLFAQDYPPDRFEIIAVDNASSDDTRSIIRRYPVRCVEEPVPGGARCRNRGVAESQGEFLAFTDADCTAPRGWISALVSVLESNPPSVFAGGDVLCGAGGSLLEAFLRARGCGFFSGGLLASRSSGRAPWLMTGNLMVRRSLFDQVGGFFEGPLPSEDIDFSWKGLLAGSYPVFVEGAAVAENRRTTLRSFYRKNYRTGRVSVLLRRRHGAAVSGGRRAGFLSPLFRLGGHLRALFRKGNGLRLSERWSWSFFLVSGHLCYLTGIARGRLSAPPSPLNPPSGCEHPLFRAHRLEPSSQLLYLCGLPEPVEPAVLEGLLRRITNWESLLSQASRHKLQQRLYVYLKRSGLSSSLAPSVWERMRVLCFEAQGFTLALDAELSGLLPVFQKAGVAPLLLKGAALQRTVYRDNPVRPYSDVDLMVRKEEAARIGPLMESLGYRFRPAPSHFPSRWHDRTFAAAGREAGFTYVHPGKGIHLDIHWEAFPSDSQFKLPAGWLWRQSRPVEGDDQQALLPDPTRLFVHLLLHLAKHAGMKENLFGWYIDLDEVARHEGWKLDGPLCLELIREVGCRRKVLEILAFAQVHFGTPLPPELDALIAAENVRPIGLEEIFQSPATGEIASLARPEWTDKREEFLGYLRRAPGWSGKAALVLRWFFPDARYLRAKYPFDTPLQKAAAFARHLLTTGIKGFVLVRYVIIKQLCRTLSVSPEK